MDETLDYIEAIGEAKGRREGNKEGMNKVNRLAAFLYRDGRMDDFMKSVNNKTYQEQLFVEYGLLGQERLE